jgi:23S rRNA (guanosine2251-2'-O)-methyltransferase
VPRGRAGDGPGGGRFVFGVNPVLEALRARPDEIESLYVAEGQLGRGPAAELLSRARDAGVRVRRLPRERLSTLAEGGVHQGVVAEVRTFSYAELDDVLHRAQASGRPPLLVALDGIQDPHNLGAIIRSAHALGAHGVIIPKDRAAPVTGAAGKASAGAIEHCPVARVTNLSRALEQLKENGLWAAAADPDGAQVLYDARLDGPLVLVVGAEGAGVRRGVLESCDFRLRIPMAGQVASLNASVSAAILLYEVARQRSGRAG